MKGADLIADLKRKLGAQTDKTLAEALGVTIQSVQNWKNRNNITPRQVSGVIKSACRAAERESQSKAIRPLVEFYSIRKSDSKGRIKHQIFSPKRINGGPHPYMSGLKEELERCHGVYIFFDSRGQAIYAGKAKKQFLWKEINLAYNRNRGDVQKIKRVRHPKLGFQYRTSDEKSRQIVDHVVPLHELANYFSAYEVADGMIDEVEALLVRGFANNLLNIRMERFGLHRQKRR